MYSHTTACVAGREDTLIWGEMKSCSLQKQARLRPLLCASMWILESHSWSQNLISDPSGKSVRLWEKWLKDNGIIDGLLRVHDDGTPLLKCHRLRW